MATRSVRVFITDARLSYPALDEPKETMAGNGDLKYQATFLIAPDNPCVAKIKDAIKQIAIAEYGDKAKAVVTNREKIPLKKGDDKENIPDGYAGMLYISAKSKNRPELRDANPKIRIVEKEEIREKFTAGYRVNAYVDLYPYAVRNSGGAIIKSGIAAGLVSVQFKAYADAFSGRAATSDDDYPDCSADAADSQSYAAGDASGGVAAAEAKTGDFGVAGDEDFDVPF